jgi:hypothetical protein
MARTNRRKHPRVEGEGITGHVKHEGEVQLALPIENISLGGMLLRCEQPLPVGSQVFLEVSRPGTKSLKLVGRVLSLVPLMKKKGASGVHGLSIRFNPMGEDATTRLQELVTSIYQHRPIPTAAPSPVRVALSQPAPAKPASPDLDFDFAARGGALAETDLDESVTGKAAASGAQFEPAEDRRGFDFDFNEPLGPAFNEPAPALLPHEQPAVTVSLGSDFDPALAAPPPPDFRPDPVSVPVPPSTQLTAKMRSEDATVEELRAMLEERNREVQALKDELLRKNTENAKLRRAVVELRHRNKPVL